jgi:hypothetical protein
MHKPLEHTFVFSMADLMPVVLIWFLKGDWLRPTSVNRRITTVIWSRPEATW